MRRAMHDHAAAGPLGLVTWAHAEWAKLPFDELVRACDVPLRDAGYLLEGLTTMELAWLVSGLAHACHRHGDEAARRFLGPARDALLERLAPTRLFVHASPRAGALERMRRRVANFADQIYPVQALAFAKSTATACSPRAAARAARRDAGLARPVVLALRRSAALVRPHPVCSVHQHGRRRGAARCSPGADLTAAAELGRLATRTSSTLLPRPRATIWRSLGASSRRSSASGASSARRSAPRREPARRAGPDACA